MKARKRIIRIRVNDAEYKKIWRHVNMNDTDISKYMRELTLFEIKRAEINSKESYPGA